MAKVYSTIFSRGLMATVGNQFVIGSTPSGKNIVANKPMFNDNRKLAHPQTMHRHSLQDATTFARFAENQDMYIEKAKEMGSTAYTVAIADWFGAPKVLQIDIDRWTGEIGQTIRVKAKDNVRIARVTVVIRDAKNNVLETGEARRSKSGSDWWTYTTRSLVSMTPFPIVEAIAQDLPGNRDSFVIS